MALLGKRSRSVIWSVFWGCGLLGAAAAGFWARARLFPDLAAQASAAYSRGDWDRAAALIQSGKMYR
jgi:hypothetical protein